MRNDNKEMPKVMIGKFVDIDLHTVHILQGLTYILLAEFKLSEKEKIISILKPIYPQVAEKLARYQGGLL